MTATASVGRAGQARSGRRSRSLRQAEEIALELGALYERARRYDEAIAVFEDQLKRNPADARAANNLAMLLASHRSDAVSLDRAASLAAQFEDSENPLFLDTYGWVQYRRGNHQAAVAALQKAATKLPAAQEIWYHLGKAQLAAGSRQEARASLERALEGNPGYSGVADARSTLAQLE